MENSSFYLTTASSLEGYKVIRQCGVVFGESLFKHGTLKQLGAGISDTIDQLKFGSRELSGSTRLLEDARNHAYQKMISEAKRRGANAVIAIDSDNTIGGEYMYISLYGTAVLVVSEKDYENELKREQARVEENRRIMAEREKVLEEKKKQFLADKERYIKENGITGEANEDVEFEDLFMAELSKAVSVEAIWQSWNSFGLGIMHRQLDAYIDMKLQAERESGVPGNFEDIKQAIIKMLDKEKNSKQNV